MDSLEIKLAKLADAKRIACMARDLIERGLPWSWDYARVSREIRSRDSVALSAWAGGRLVGFAIMHFGQDSAHLNLLGVEPRYQRLGIGHELLAWLEKTACVAGTFVVSLEVRASNRKALAFYRKLGYRELVVIPKYYSGREAAVRMNRDLRSTRTMDAA